MSSMIGIGGHSNWDRRPCDPISTVPDRTPVPARPWSRSDRRSGTGQWLGLGTRVSARRLYRTGQFVEYGSYRTTPDTSLSTIYLEGSPGAYISRPVSEPVPRDIYLVDQSPEGMFSLWVSSEVYISPEGCLRGGIPCSEGYLRRYTFRASLEGVSLFVVLRWGWGIPLPCSFFSLFFFFVLFRSSSLGSSCLLFVVMSGYPVLFH